jgi:hypothetical protein
MDDGRTKEIKMATWKLSTKYDNNTIERQMWVKNGIKVIRDQCWVQASWTVQSDQKPNIDLVNQNGYNVTNSEYNWQLDSVTDQAWNKWAFTKSTSEAEQERIKLLWASNGDAGMSNDGWAKANTEYLIYSKLKLVNQDTGEQWIGE